LTKNRGKPPKKRNRKAPDLHAHQNILKFNNNIAGASPIADRFEDIIRELYLAIDEEIISNSRRATLRSAQKFPTLKDESTIKFRKPSRLIE
jgi:hypothetical protein